MQTDANKCGRRFMGAVKFACAPLPAQIARKGTPLALKDDQKYIQERKKDLGLQYTESLE